MSERDENGRLKLPNPSYVPFQRMRTRPDKGSKNNSRRESPDHSRGGSRAQQNRRSTESKRSSRSQSFNVSELGNSKDEDRDGYYYDGDNENDDKRSRRFKSRSRNSDGEDVSRSLTNLSLENGKKQRSRSLTEGNENSNKMPYIPFQRVQKIKKRPAMQESDSAFRVPAYNVLRDRKDFRFKTDLYRSDGYTSEYRSRYLERQKARRKAARQKNQSNLSSLLRDPLHIQRRRGSKSEDEHHNGESEEGSTRLSTRDSKRSEGSNNHTEEGSPVSSSGSVKLPQIQPSPTMTGDSARSVNGTGASRPDILTIGSVKSANGTGDSQPDMLILDNAKTVSGKGAAQPTFMNVDSVTSSKISENVPTALTPVEITKSLPDTLLTKDNGKSANETGNASSRVASSPNASVLKVSETSKSEQPQLLAKLQPNDTAKWVEGKGAGRLSHFFKLKKAEPTIVPELTKTAENSKNEEISKDQNLNHLNHNETEDTRRKFKQFNLTDKEKRMSPKNSVLLPAVTPSAKNDDDRSKLLTRSKSDSILYSSRIRAKNNQSLKPNEILIFKENAKTKSIFKGARPKTCLPQIILTIPEEQIGQRKNRILDTCSYKNIKKGTTRQDEVLSLPKINVSKFETFKESKTSTKNYRPKSSRPYRNSQKSLTTSQKTNKLQAKQSERSRNRKVISTLHKSHISTVNKNKMTGKSNSSEPNNQLHLLKVSKNQSNHKLLNTSKTYSKSRSKSTSVSPRFSKGKKIEDKVHGNPKIEPIPFVRETASTVEVLGAYDRSNVKKHMHKIRNKRAQRLEQFAHFLGPKKASESAVHNK